MFRTLMMVVAAAMLISPPSLAGTPFIPAADKMALIEAGVRSRLLEPDSAVLSEVIATEDASGPALVWVCGKVKAKNSLGGYAQPVPFIGTLVTENSGAVIFLPMAVSGPSNEEQLRVISTCLEKF